MEGGSAASPPRAAAEHSHRLAYAHTSAHEASFSEGVGETICTGAKARGRWAPSHRRSECPFNTSSHPVLTSCLRSCEFVTVKAIDGAGYLPWVAAQCPTC